MNKEKIITSICLSLLFLMLCSIIPHKIYTKRHTETSDIIEINWEKLYPFSKTNNQIEKQDNTSNNIIKKIINKLNRLYEENDCNIYKTYLGSIKKVENKIENTFNEHIFFRTKLIELNGKIAKITNQKYFKGKERVVNTKEDYLVFLENKNDITDEAYLLIEFSKYLKKNNIDLLYVQSPDKVNKFSKEDLIDGYKDNSNDNADGFISIVKKANINVLDLRDEINKQYSNEEYYKLFFKTDNHWLPSTGLWATQVLSKYLKDNYKFNINTKVYDINNYNVQKFEKLMFGAIGRRVSLGYAKPEDFNLYYPKFETNFHVKVPSMAIEKSGDFYNTLINQKKFNQSDYYKNDIYGTYGYSNQAIVNIDNLNVTGGKKVLLIKDSFAETVFPFLAIEMNKLDIIDLRDFTGSLKAYINENKPDMIIVMYNPSSLNNKNFSTEHTNTFDFK